MIRYINLTLIILISISVFNSASNIDHVSWFVNGAFAEYSARVLRVLFRNGSVYRSYGLFRLRWVINSVREDVAELNVSIFFKYLEPMNNISGAINDLIISRRVYVNLSNNFLVDNSGKALGFNNFWLLTKYIKLGRYSDELIKRIVDYFESTGINMSYLGYTYYSINVTDNGKPIYGYIFSVPIDTYTIYGKIPGPAYYLLTENTSLYTDGRFAGSLMLIYDPFTGLLLGGMYTFSDLLYNLFNISTIGLIELMNTTQSFGKKAGLSTPDLSLSNTNIYDIINKGVEQETTIEYQFLYAIVVITIAVLIAILIYSKFHKVRKL